MSAEATAIRALVTARLAERAGREDVTAVAEEAAALPGQVQHFRALLSSGDAPDGLCLILAERAGG